MNESELTIIIPVFNEVQLIGKVVADWHAEAERLGIRHAIRVYDDDSSDGSREALAALLPLSPWLSLVNRPHSGHGPAIRQGYAEAETPWVFQVDSDDEIDTGAFADLWSRRETYDLLMGYRTTPRQSRTRKGVSHLARLAVRLLFEQTVRDVNCPYRLIRVSSLKSILPLIPADAFAPNVLMSGLAIRAGWKVYETPVTCRFGKHRPSYLRHVKLVRAAIRSFRELRRAARPMED